MGTYELSAELAHGYPRYSKRAAGGKTLWLYRSSGSGGWMVTDDESNIAKNLGWLNSAPAAALPTEAGLAWQYYDGTWDDDPKMICTEVPPRTPSAPSLPLPRSLPFPTTATAPPRGHAARRKSAPACVRDKLTLPSSPLPHPRRGAFHPRSPSPGVRERRRR